MSRFGPSDSWKRLSLLRLRDAAAAQCEDSAAAAQMAGHMQHQDSARERRADGLHGPDACIVTYANHEVTEIMESWGLVRVLCSALGLPAGSSTVP
jgi:hypothetical protein